MVYRLMVSLVLMSFTLSAAADDDTASQLQRSLQLTSMKPSDRPSDVPTPGEMGRRHGLLLVPLLRPYTESEDIRSQLEAAKAMLGIQSSCDELPERQQLVDELVRWFCDPKCLCMSVVERLLNAMRAEDFSEDAKTALLGRLRQAQAQAEHDPERYKTYVLMAGLADVTQALPLLEEEAYKPSDEVEKIVSTVTQWRGTVAWSTLKARARMGVKEDVRLCIRFAEAVPDKRDRAAHLFDSISYVRQPEIVEYLASHLNDDTLPESRSIDAIEYSPAQRAAMALSKMLEGFPMKPNGNPTPEKLEECRIWMKGRTEYPLIR